MLHADGAFVDVRVVLEAGGAKECIAETSKLYLPRTTLFNLPGPPDPLPQGR